MINLTSSQLQQCLPTNKHIDDWYPQVMAILPVHNITTINRVAAFLAQCGYESLDFNILEENLNYSAAGLMKTWPSRFNSTLANRVARNPEAIANIVYAGRLGNGASSSGDGWNYRGRGLVQLTGKSNYNSCSSAIYGDDRLMANPDEAATQEGAINSACWFWDTHGLNSLADATEITLMSQRINGGNLGLQERIARYNHCYSILQGD